MVGERPTARQATVWVADGRATALRRRAHRRSVRGRSAAARARRSALDIGMLDRLAREIASYGADAVVLEPASLRDGRRREPAAGAQAGERERSDA